MYFLQQDEWWAPSKYCACSLNWPLMQWLVCPRYDLLHFNRMAYTTFAHRTYGVACFFENPDFFLAGLVARGQSSVCLFVAEKKTNGTAWRFATFRLCDTLCTYGITSGFVVFHSRTTFFLLVCPSSFEVELPLPLRAI